MDSSPAARAGTPDTKSPRPAYEGPNRGLGEAHTRTMQPGAHTALYRKIPISASAKTAGGSKTKIPPPAGPALACRFPTGRHSAGAAYEVIGKIRLMALFTRIARPGHACPLAP